MRQKYSRGAEKGVSNAPVPKDLLGSTFVCVDVGGWDRQRIPEAVASPFLPGLLESNTKILVLL